VLTGFPFGHGHTKVSVPVGAHAEVTIGDEGYRVRFSGYPTLANPTPANLTLANPSPTTSRPGSRRAGSFRVRAAGWETDRDALRAVRHAVFVIEQGVPEALEWDASDPVSRHALAVDGEGRAIGTGRLLPDGHIGRVAVLPAWRGCGVGAELLRHLVDEARGRGLREVVLNAQTHAMGFYGRLGFVPSGEPFDEAGIPHREMRRAL
jgi:predicted GNAT family N-acyltransferase